MAQKRVAVFIDLANINGSIQRLRNKNTFPQEAGFDFSKLTDKIIPLGSEVASKNIYIDVRKDVDPKKQKGFIDSFKRKGFNVVTKEAKYITQNNGEEKTKANMDVELTTDICRSFWRRDCEEIILISGDSDFAYIANELKNSMITVTIVSSADTISKELRERADRLILLDDIDLKEFVMHRPKKS